VCGACLGLARQQLLSAGVVPDPTLGAIYQLTGTNLSAVSWREALRYNEVFQKSSKNSNARSESLLDQLVYHRVRSFELDLHTVRGALAWAQPAPVRDWWMTHGTVGGVYEAHHHDRLSDVLGQLRLFHDLFPAHEVITLFLNVGDKFGGVPQKGHRPEDLDSLLARILGSEALYTPKDLKGSASSIQAGAKKGWPSLGALRGKFLAVVVEGAAGYADAQDLAEPRTCFVAKQNVTHAELIHRHNWIVFFDQSGPTAPLSRDIDKANFVSRQGVESRAAFQQAMRHRAHHLASRAVNPHHSSWSRSHTPRGFPFLPFLHGHKGFDTATAEEPMDIIDVSCSTGPLWGTHDSAVFVSREDRTPDGQWVEYQWLGANANSHVGKWARAGIALRGSREDEGAAYFALVRPSQSSLPSQVQLRSHPEGPTTAAPARSATAVLFRVRCRYTRGSTECEGYYSDDAKRWRLIRNATVPQRLTFHGLIASTQSDAKHPDGAPYRFLFANLSRNGQALRRADFPTVTELGAVYGVPHVADGFHDEDDPW